LINRQQQNVLAT